MKAIIKQINKIASGYAVIIDIEGKNPMQLEFSENVKKKEIEDKIKDVFVKS